MSLNDVAILDRQLSNEVDFILYSYNEYSFEEKSFQSVSELLHFFEDDQKSKTKCYWIEVLIHESPNLAKHIRILCEHFHIHPLTIEDISTLTSSMKLDLFTNDSSLYLLMKILTWNGRRVEQQQISFYLKCSQNLLITFQEKSTKTTEALFQIIQNRLRRQQNNDENSQHYQQTRLRQLNIDYLFYCLLDHIIDRYMSVMEEISNRIGQLDDILMTNTQARTLITLHSIYRLKHDLLHLRILFNPLKEIISRLQRTTSDEHYLSFPRTDPSLRLGMKHHILRRQPKTGRPLINNHTRKTTKSTSIYLNEYIYVYLHDLNNHVNQLIDSLEIQRESVSFLISFWITLNSNETQEILQILMLISVLFMPCTLFTGMNSTNFRIQPQYKYQYGYYIILSLLSLILSGMIIWYKSKKWI